MPSRTASGFSRENRLRERVALQPAPEGGGRRGEIIIVASKPRNEEENSARHLEHTVARLTLPQPPSNSLAQAESA